MASVWVFTPWYPGPAEPWHGTFIHNQVTALRSLGVDTRVVKLTWGRPWIRICEVDPDGGTPLAPERYTWDAHAERLRDVLEKVVRQRRGDTSCDRSGGADAKP